MTDASPAGDKLKTVELHGASEASGLAAVADRALLDARHWDMAFWSVLDEGRIEGALVLIGHRADGAGDKHGWQLETPGRARNASREGRVRRFTDPGKSTADGEAVAHHDGFVYAVGSHFGSLEDGLEPKRSFVARFYETDTADPVGADVGLEVWRNDFQLHRLVNDALQERGIPLLPVSHDAQERFIRATRQRGEREDKPWADRIEPDDWPLNIEGAAFRPNGDLLLGLRCPVSEAGHPLVIELAGFASAFDPSGPMPPVTAVWVLDGISSATQPLGVRDLNADADGETFSVIAGGLDREVLRDRDRHGSPTFSHWQVTLPAAGAGAGGPSELLLRTFPTLERLEGVGRRPDGGFIYVTDEKRVALHYVPW